MANSHTHPTSHIQSTHQAQKGRTYPVSQARCWKAPSLPPHYSSGQRPQASRINLAFCHLLPHRGRVTLTLLGPSLEAGKSSRQLHHLPQNDSIPQGDTHSSCHLLQGCWPLPTTPFTPSHGDLWWPRRHRGAWDLSPSQATASIPYFRGYLPCEAFPDLSPACP
jgi:hypothetical protein